MFRRWLWLKLGSTRALWGRHGRKPRIEPLEDRFLMNADSPLVNLQSLYQSLPLSFEANQGQRAPQVQFTSSGPGYTLFLTPASAYLSLQKDQTTGTATPSLVQMQLLGANGNAVGVGLGQQDFTSNYLIGNDASQWHKDVANFSSVKFSDVYKGIDLIYYGNERELEYDFVVAPGANPGAIALAFPGSGNLSLDAAGDLVVHTTGGDLVEHAPVLYQMNGSQKVAVSGNYVIGADNTVRFQVGSYDHSLPLVIDPVLSYATYLGGSGADNGQAVAVDGAGNVYVTGFTGSTNFPTVGAEQGQLAGQGNVFVAKINPAGTGLVYSTYVGGAGFDLGLALRVDGAGNAYVAGTTTSFNFPAVNAIQATFGGGSDAFVFKLNPTGSQLVFSTYLGGAGVEFAQGLALDGSNNIYVVGFTYSTNFPTANAVQPKSNGGQDAWAAKIASTGTSFIFSTYLGGSNDDSAQAVGTDAAGNLYVVGDTFSSDFPTKNPLRQSSGGDDAFLTKLSANGSAILYSTYLGGSGDDRASAIRQDASGNIYIAGTTGSADFPTLNALQSTFGGNTDVFLTKLNSAGSAILFSTYLGGSDVDQALSLAIDSSSNLYVVGFTASTDFPTVNAAQATIGGGDGDAFIAKISSNGSSLIYSTYFGGADDDRAMGVAVDGLGNIYVVGTTASSNLPIANALQPGFGGSFDGFVVKLSQAPATQLGVAGPASTAGNTFSITVSALDSQGNPAGDYTGTIHFTSSDPLAVLPANYTFTAADKGVHTFTGLQLKSVGTQSITATDLANNTIVGSRTGIAVGAPATSFTFTSMPSVTTAGVPNSITITARDAQGNVATGYTGSVHFTTADPRGVVPADYQFTPADHGVHTFSMVVLKTPGVQSITATDTTLPNIKGTQANITVNASPTSLATHFSVTIPAQINSGSPVGITITALDLTNALAADYRGTIHFTSSDSSAILPADYTFTAADQGVHTFKATFQSVQPLTITATDTAKSTITGSISSIRVNPPVGQFVVTPSVTTVLVGTPITITVTAQDILLGTATGYQGTVHFTSNDALAGLPADYTFTAADQGVHTFQVTFNTAGSRSIMVTDTVTSTVKGSNGLTVTSTAAGVVFSGMAQSTPEGTAQSVTITIVDAQGNPVTNYTGTIKFTSSDGQAVLPANYTFTGADQGKHTVQVTFKTPGAQTLTATDTASSTLKATANVTVTVVAQILVLSSLGQTGAAGATQSVTVTLTDNSGNVATGYVGTVHFTSTDARAALPADYTFTAADQGKHTFQVTFKTTGTQSLTATDTSNSALKASSSLAVTTTAQILSITGLGQSASAGTSQSVTVTLTDTFGNIATGYVGTVHFTSTDTQAGLPVDYTFTAADQGKHTFQVTFKTTGAQLLTSTDTSNSALKATSNISVTTSAQLVAVTGLGQSVAAGASQTITVTLTDSLGNVATGYTGTIHFTSTDGKAVLPADYTFTGADQGKHTFQVSFKTTGAQSITATDSNNSTLKATANTSVTTTAQILAFSGLGQSAVAGTPQSVTVTLTDSFGNIATGYVGTVHFTSTDGQAGLPVDYTFTAADQGKHTFQVTFKTTGAQSLTATDTSNSTLKATSSLTVTTVAQILTITGLGQNATAGAVQNVTITLTDSFGNIATGYVGSVHFTSTDGQAVLPADYTFTAADQGKHTFQVTFKTAGAQSLTSTDKTNGSLAGSANVNVTTSAQIVVLGGLPQTTSAGTTQNFTVSVTDSFGNPITGYLGTIHFTSTDGQAGLPADFTFTATDQGRHTFQVTFKTTGAQSLTATDTSNSTLKATGSLTVTTVAQILTITGLGQNATAGAAQNVIVTLTDSFGNIATGYTGTIHFTSTDGQAVLPADFTFTAADQGKHTFQVTFKTAGAQSLTSTDKANGSLAGSANTTVTTSAQIVVLGGLPQTTSAGTTQNFTVSVTDSFGNPITGYLGTIHFTSTDGQAGLPADYTFTSADQGRHTFQVTFKTTGAQSLTATDTSNSALKATGSLTVTTVAQILTITGLGQNATAGAVQTVTVTLTDNFGNIATGYVGTIHLTSTDGQAVLPADFTFTAADHGTRTLQVTFKTAGSQSLTATDKANVSLAGSANVNVTTSAQIVVLTGLPQTTSAGMTQSVTITLTDSFGNIATGYVGTVHFTSTDGNAVLPADYTFTAADLGTHTFQITFKTTGLQSFTVSDNANSSLRALANTTVTTTAQILSLSGISQTAVAGTPQSVTVTLTDVFGNIATRYTGTIHFTSSDARGILPANFTFTAADQGSHTFQVNWTTPGAQSVGVADTANSDLSASANVTVSVAAQLVVLSDLGQNAVAGVPQTITVTLKDSLGNIATGYVGTVHFSSSDTRAGLPANYTFTAADQGIHTFQVTFKTTGAQSLVVADTVNSTLNASANVSVTTSAQLVVLSGLGQNATAGAAQSVTVTITDNFGNVVTGYVGTIHFTSTDGQAVLPADFTFTAADQGKHTGQVTFKTTGVQSLAVADTANSGLGASANLTVTTSAQLVVLSGLGQNAAAGAAQSVTVTLTDNFGNVVTDYVGKIHFSSSDAKAGLPADYTLTSTDQGKHTFQVTFKTTGTQSLLVTDAANSSVNASANVNVTTSAQLVILDGLGQNAAAGTVQNVTVTLEDKFGNTITDYVGTVHFTSSDGQAVLPADYTFTSADQGKHTFQITFKTTGSQSLVVADTANSGLNTSAIVNVTTSAQLVVLGGLGQSTVAGVAQSITVTLTDSFGNIVTGYVGTIHFSSSDTKAGLPADYTFTSADQGKHTFQITFKTTGTQALAVTDAANSTLKASTNVSVTTSAQLVVLSGIGQNATAGATQNVTVTLTDNFGNVVTGYVGTVHFSSTDVQAGLPTDYTFTAADQGQHTFQVTFKTTGAQSLAVADTANNALKASATVSVTTTAQLVVLSGLGQTAAAGSAQSITVTLTDSFGNVVTGYVGKVHFTSSDTQAGLPADYTFPFDEQGKHTFQVTFKTTGTQSLAVADTANSALKASTNVSVTTSAQLVVLSGIGQNATAGSALSVTVTITDSFGNVVTGYVGTVHFTSTDGQAVLPADYTFTAGDQGKHTFQVTFKTTGTQSLAVADTANSVLKASTSVTVTTSAQLVVLSGIGQNVTAGSAQSVTVTLTDNFGNVVTGYLGKVHFSSSDVLAGLPSDYTFTSADQGKHTFQVTFKTTGTQSLAVTDTANSTLQATANVTVTTSAQLVVLSGLGQNALAGSAQSVTVTLTDSFGNVVTGYVGKVHFSSGDAQAGLPADYTFTAADQGKHTFQVTFKTTGSQSLAVADAINASLKASANVSVTTVAQKLVLGGMSVSATAGAPQTLTITVTDNFGNVVTNYLGTLHFSSSDAQAALPADFTFTAADQGKHTIAVTLNTVGTQSIAVADSANANIQGVISGIAVTQAQSSTAVRLQITGPSSIVAGQSATFTITALDAQGRVATSYRGTIFWISTDSTTTGIRGFTFGAADQGKHTFTLTFNTIGTQSLSAFDQQNIALFGTYSGISVTPPATVASSLSALMPSQVSTGSLNALTIIVLDSQGRPVTNYQGTLHFQSSDPTAVLPADYTFTAQDQGTHVFTLSMHTLGLQSVTVTDLANPQALNASLSIMAVPGTRTWTGKGPDTLWSDPANWDGGVIPHSGDTVVLKGSGSQAGTTYDLGSATSLKSLVLAGANFKITGGTLTITDSIDATLATGTNTIQASLNLGGKVQILGGAGQLVFAGPVNVNAFTLTVDAESSNVVFSSTLSGTGGLILSSGVLTLAGSGSNNLTGAVRVDGGTLQLAQSGGTALIGRLTIGSSQGNARSATVLLLGSNQIADAALVCVNATGFLNLAGQKSNLASLTLAGGEVETGMGTLTLDGDLTTSSGTSTLGGILTIAGGSRGFNIANGATLNLTATIGGSGTLTKTGAGTLVLAGNSSFAGTVTVTAGSLILNGSLLASQAIVRSGATIGGSGQLGSLTLQGGSYQPGPNSGTLTVQSGVALANGSLFTANLTPSGSNKLVSSGQIALTGSVLKLSLNYQPPTGATFTIASAAQGIVGTFAGLPEGATISINGMMMRITYQGGPGGHDVVLTVL